MNYDDILTKQMAHLSTICEQKELKDKSHSCQNFPIYNLQST